MTVGSKDCYTGYNAKILAFLGNPRGRSPLVEPPAPRTVSPQAKPCNGYAVAPSPQRGTPRCSLSNGRFPVAHRRWSGQFAVAPTPQKALAGAECFGSAAAEIPVAEPYKYSPWLRPRNEGTPAAVSKSARVQPFKCSKQVMLATRKLPLLPLLCRKRRTSFRRGLPYRGARIPRRDPPGRSPLSLRCGSGPLAVAR